MARKRGSRTRFGRLLKVIFWVCVAFFLSVMFTPLPNLLSSYLTVEPNIKKADVIVVLGGRILPKRGAEPCFYGQNCKGHNPVFGG